jgi:hypothetical protein
MLALAADRHTSRLYQNLPPSATTTTKRDRSVESPDQLHIHGPDPYSENSTNQNLSGHSTARPAGLSPVEIREPPRVQSACVVLAISVAASAATFFDFREP